MGREITTEEFQDKVAEIFLEDEDTTSVMDGYIRGFLSHEEMSKRMEFLKMQAESMADSYFETLAEEADKDLADSKLDMEQEDNWEHGG